MINRKSIKMIIMNTNEALKMKVRGNMMIKIDALDETDDGKTKKIYNFIFIVIKFLSTRRPV
jgi:hypothetical protein